MSAPHITLKNVSVRFRRYQGYPEGLKEAVLRKLVPPRWQKALVPKRQEIWGVKNLSLDLRPGDRLAVIGHNGAGKSTLLKLISRIYRATEGVAEVEGRVAPLIELGAGFNPELTGRENAFLNAAILGIPGKVLKPRLASLVEFAGLEEHIDVPVKYYSTGMLLRLAFAVATEVTPDILILDELFAGADAEFIERANQRLDEFVRTSPIFILVSHELKYVERFCNKAILLERGELVASGNPQSVIETYLSRFSPVETQSKKPSPAELP
jgi:ABC-type polysaccharide/polyol phosphate transport system ATPase subunit